MVNINGRERKRAETRLRACGVLGPDEEVKGAVEAVSFDDTLGEIREVVEEGLSEDRVIPVNTIDMYEVIADFEAEIRAQQIARVNDETEIRAQQIACVNKEAEIRAQ